MGLNQQLWENDGFSHSTIVYSRRYWDLNRCYFHFEVWKAHLLLMADNWVQIDIYSK